MKEIYLQANFFSGSWTIFKDYVHEIFGLKCGTDFRDSFSDYGLKEPAWTTLTVRGVCNHWRENATK